MITWKTLQKSYTKLELHTVKKLIGIFSLSEMYIMWYDLDNRNFVYG